MSARGVRLLTYADRLGGDLRRLGAVLDGPLADIVGVHVLPFYTPFDGDDAGFDPVDHTAVDPRLGGKPRRLHGHRHGARAEARLQIHADPQPLDLFRRLRTAPEQVFHLVQREHAAPKLRNTNEL